MKRLLIICLTFFISFSTVFSQNIGLNDKLPQDPKVLTGTLPNGMNYYIRTNAVPEKRAEFTLVINAGSVLEDEDQQGLAHFTEHMAFNGTTNYPKHELINYLESIGMKFGADLNAYTSFDETVYGFTVPTDSMGFIDKGLLVLHDWATEISFEQDEIAAESGVVHEEWRMHQGAMYRVQENMLKAIFNNSRYAFRSPIGKMEIVDNVNRDVLLRFYEDWYRPDLMAVVLVGDFDAKEMETKVKNIFSKIEPVKNPRERVYTEIPDNPKPIINVASDKEIPSSMIQMLYKHKAEPQVTVADYVKSLRENILSEMLSNRLTELTNQENPPFVMAQAGIDNLVGPVQVFMNFAMLQNNDYKKALNALTIENNRMEQFGFSEPELDRVKKSILKSYEKMYNEREKQKSSGYVNEYKTHYLYPHVPFPGIEYEYALANKFIPEITLNEINEMAKEQITEENLVIVLILPEKNGVTVPTEEDVLKTYNEALKQKVEPYINKENNANLISKMPQKGKIAKVEKNKELEYETWTLKNGIKVVIKPTNFKDDEILFYAKSNGGTSLVSDKDFISASIAAEVAAESGLGPFDKTDLQKFLSDKNVRFRTYIGQISETVSGSSSIADLETLLQMVYVQFTDPKVTESAFKAYINKTKPLLENNSLSPERVWQDSIGWIFSDRNFRARTMTPEILDEANFNRIKSIYTNRFSDPINFTFYLIGNIDAKTTKPLVELYLGSLQGVERTEIYKDLGNRPVKGKVEKQVLLGNDPKCMEICLFHGETEYNPLNNLQLDAICKILTTRLLEDIREKESGVYTIGAYPQFTALPYPHYAVQIFFSCDPARETELFTKSLAIIDALRNGEISETEINKTIEKEKREFETETKENSYWRSLLEDINDGITTSKEYTDYLNLVNSQISIKSMTDAAKKYFDMNNYVKVFLTPEK